MHQIVCRLGLGPRPHWGSLQRSPDPLAGLRGLLLRGEGEGRGWEGREGKGREGVPVKFWLGIHPCLSPTPSTFVLNVFMYATPQTQLVYQTSLDLMIADVAEINWGLPRILVLKFLFVSYCQCPSCEKVCSTCASMMTGEECFEQKKLILIMQNLWI